MSALKYIPKKRATTRQAREIVAEETDHSKCIGTIHRRQEKNPHNITSQLKAELVAMRLALRNSSLPCFQRRVIWRLYRSTTRKLRAIA
jgi:hypothetical protein